MLGCDHSHTFFVRLLLGSKVLCKRILLYQFKTNFMDLQLKNKSVLVSGSSAGIGYAIAKAFANEDAIVYINGRNASKVMEAVNSIQSETGNMQVFGITADLATVEGFERLARELGEVDILVNNLGLFEPVDFFESKDEDWIKLFEVN